VHVDLVVAIADLHSAGTTQVPAAQALPSAIRLKEVQQFLGSHEERFATTWPGSRQHISQAACPGADQRILIAGTPSDQGSDQLPQPGIRGHDRITIIADSIPGGATHQRIQQDRYRIHRPSPQGTPS
jgi:hypothetical protein